MSAQAKAAPPAFSFDGLKRRALSLGAAKSFDYVMQFLLPVVLVRCLDAVTFGEYRLLWLAVGTVMVVATLGMPGSLYFFMPRSDPATRRMLLAQTIAFLGVSGLICAWALSPWNPWQPAALQPLAKYGALVPAFVALWVTAFLIDMLPTIDERVGMQAGVTIGLSFLRVAVLGLGAYATGSMEVLLWLLVAMVLIKIAVQFAYIARFHGVSRPWFDRKLFSRQFRHAAPFGLSNALFGLRSQADQWVAAWLFSLGSFAAFSIAAVLSPLVSLFRSSVNEAFLPSMSRLQAAGDFRGMLELNSRANVLVGTLLYPMLAFGFVFAEELVTLVYTATYIEAAPVMRVYILSLAVMVVEVGSLVLLLREGQFTMQVNCVALAASVGISVVGAMHAGLPGAAAGSVLALLGDRAMVLHRISRRTGIALARMQDWRGLGLALLFAVLASLVAWGAVHFFCAHCTPLMRLAIGGGVLILAYGLLALRKARQ